MGSPVFDGIFDSFDKDLLGKEARASQRRDTSSGDAERQQQDPGRDQSAEGARDEDPDGANFDVIFESFDNSTMDVLDEMRPPHSSQSVVKRPRAPAPKVTSREAQEKEIDPIDVSDIFGDLLMSPALPFPSSDHLPPSPPPRPGVLAERRHLAQRKRPLSLQYPDATRTNHPTLPHQRTCHVSTARPRHIQDGALLFRFCRLANHRTYQIAPFSFGFLLPSTSPFELHVKDIAFRAPRSFARLQTGSDLRGGFLSELQIYHLFN